MRILWMSDNPLIRTSYGNATRYVCAGLADLGHDVSILGWDMQGQPMAWRNCILYPSGFSAKELLHYFRHLQPDVLIILADVRWLTNINYPLIANFMDSAGIPRVLYYPIDADMGENRLPPSWVRVLKTFDLPITMSRYGHDVTQANGIEPAYIPLGIDTRVFQPPANKLFAKQAFGYEGKFVILSNVRNQSSKILPRTLEIFQHFAADKDDAILHLHCDPDDPFAPSCEDVYNLRSDIAFLNLTGKVCLTKNISTFTELPTEQLAQLYRATDVHLLASGRESIGLPTLQAAASGVVPLAPNYAVSQELVGKHGEAIGFRHFLPDEFGLRRGLINIEEAISKLETLYRDRELLACKAQNARKFALSYDWEGIVTQWDELLQRIACKRTRSASLVNASGIPTNPHKEDGPLGLAREERKVSELVTKLCEDIRPEHTLRIPVTLPLVRFKQRVIGCIYVASQRDVPIALALHRIFPRLKVWSTIPLDFASSVPHSKTLRAKVIQATSPLYQPNLAMSTLALDMGSFDPLLPIEAAKLGVPCIGLAQHGEQAWLWPDLSLEKPDPMMAANLGRQMLTDQGCAADLCLAARQRLINILTPNNDRLLGSLRK